MVTPNATADEVRAIREQLDLLLATARKLRRGTQPQMPMISPADVPAYLRDLRERAHMIAQLPGADTIERGVGYEVAKLPVDVQSAFDSLGGFAGIVAEMDRLIPIIENAHDAAKQLEKSL